MYIGRQRGVKGLSILFGESSLQRLIVEAIPHGLPPMPSPVPSLAHNHPSIPSIPHLSMCNALDQLVRTT